MFDGLIALEYLYLRRNSLSTLPAGVFDGLTALTTLDLWINSLSTLPAGVFDGLTALTQLWLGENSLATLPAGVFDGLRADALYLFDNSFHASRRRVREPDRADDAAAGWQSGGALRAHRGSLPDDGEVFGRRGRCDLDGSGSDGGRGARM